MDKRFIGMATVLELRSDGAQRIQCGKLVVWFTGVDRIKDLKPDDQGKLYFITTPTRACYSFEKIENETSKSP